MSLFFNKACTLVFFVLIFMESSAQVISGKITDNKNELLPGAVAELRNSHDSTLAKAGIADASGQFMFENIKAGNYFVKVSLIGFDAHQTESFAYDGSAAKELPSVILTQNAVNLKEANVVGIKPLIEVRSDKTVFNVENSINATGSNALELLQKSPGVVVDNNDNVMLKGRSGVLVKIDGKDMHMSQQELGDYLRSIQSVDVEAIELISNPSSKYDAEGTAGIIDIRLKKNKNFGTNGSLTLGYTYGKHSRYNTAISLNNRSKKLNLFSNYSNNWGERTNEFYLYREQNPYIFDASSMFNRWGLSHNYKAGADYSINKKNTVGVMVNGNYSNNDGTNISRTYIHDFDTGHLDSLLSSDQTVTGNTNNINLNLNHHLAGASGQDMVTDLDIGYYVNDRDNYQPNIYSIPDEDIILSEKYNRFTTDTKIKIYTLKTDYLQDFLKGKTGIGYKLSFVNTDNNYNYYNIINTVQILDPSLSNHFVYTENVYAFYLNYQRTIKQFDFQAGVRMEHTFSEGDLKSAADTMADKNVKRNYTDFFPSAGITYNANQDNAIAILYTSRIDRPNYQELNPFEYKLDELSYRKGNPFLDPQYSNKIELSHTYKFATTASIGYSHTRDFFAQITDTISGGRSYLTTQNLATEDILSVNVSSSQQLTKWYSLYINMGLYNQKYKADFGGTKTIDESVTSFNLYAQNTIKLPYDFTFEISGWYNSSGVWGGAYVTEAQGSLDLGLQKKLFNDQGSLKLTCTDILHTAPWDSHNIYAGIVIRANGDWESQQFRASFTWRFGNKQMKGMKQRSGGSEEERKRLSGGE